MPSIAPPAHTRTPKTSDDWITPKWLIDLLGPFDLDPCASMNQPWWCAYYNWTDDGLDPDRPWYGCVWLNPPYGRETGLWLQRLAEHGSGIALIFARTDTAMFFDHVWPKATGLLFLKGRLTFCRPNGTPAKHNSGGPSLLVAYGLEADGRIQANNDLGKYVRLTRCERRRIKR